MLIRFQRCPGGWRGLGLLLAAAVLSSGRAEEPLPDEARLQSSAVLRHLRPNPAGAGGSTGPAATLARMHVPPGFRVDLVAGEPDLHQPVAMAWDERGRLWVAEAHSYPTKRPAGQGLDQLVIFEDGDGDGRFETRKVFASKLNLVSGFEVGFGGVWVGAAPELLFIPDRNRDDQPDGPPEVLLDGFGYQDTHECLNSFLWGPDGWLYGIQGVFNFARIGKPGAPDAQRQELRAGVWRYHPLRHAFEIFAHGGSNPWGLDFDERGQFFMTHCRSYWGRGGTTHVIQGGHYWNQANANHAPFIVANPPAGHPDYRNYLLASARYDHGAGGAGVPGSDAIYGGHSHVGTMIYLGDNWPEAYRGHLFTHNLHGHQINQQVNRRWGSGFDTVHAGLDVFFCSDPAYVAVDLQYGPDGAVYFIDWYDRQHCHNPNTERWDRGNGRLYRMAWAETWKPIKVDLGAMSDDRLAELHGHRNDWHARTARRLLQERAAAGRLKPEIAPAVGGIFADHVDPAIRLRALWTLHAVGSLNPDVIQRGLVDPDEFVRGWTIQLALESSRLPADLASRLARLAAEDPSPVVRRHLASGLPRLDEATAWSVIRALAAHGEDREDRNLPYLLWHGMAPRMAGNLDRALEVAGATLLPQLADWIQWYAATLEGGALERVVAALDGLPDDVLRRRLAGLWLALEPRANLSMPAAWGRIAPGLYAHADTAVRRQVEQIAAALGDSSAFPRLRTTLADAAAPAEARKHAFAVLSRAADPASLPVFLGLLDDPAFRVPVIGLLGRFDSPEAARTLLVKLAGLGASERTAALNTLTGRASFASALLDAVAQGALKRDTLNAFHVRRLVALQNPEIDRRVAATWGRIQASAGETRQRIDVLEKTFNEAPLWAYDGRAGRQHFQKLCASCHVLGPDGARLGPELTGAGRNGIRYFLENVVDPNAVVGTDFQLTRLETRQGEVVSGLLVGETGSALTLRTTTDHRVVPKSDVVQRETTDRSLMPEGLLESLAPREQIELLKYLTGS